MMADIDLIAQYDKKSPITEAYRAVRTNLQFAGAGKQIKLISFTSTTPFEGKSITISNVAITMAQDDKKVLLIDCDMRKPVQHKKFGLPNKGLSNCIATGADLDEVIQKEVLPNLDILPSGPVPPNPSELLGSARMSDILKDTTEAYDYVLLDMPPVLPVTDAAVLGSKVDGVVFVISAGSVAPEEVKEAQNRLKQSGANVLGVILNKVPQHRGYGYNSGYYYYYYYDDDHTKHKGHRHHHHHTEEDSDK